MENLPWYVSFVFVCSTCITLLFFSLSAASSKKIIIVSFIWLAIQGAVGYLEFYLNTDTVPPRFPLLLGPPLVGIILLFSTTKGRVFIDSLNLKHLTWLHMVRIPVEFTLYWLFIGKLVPELMTFEGRNFDILSGLSAPVIAYLYFTKKSIGKTVLIVWNLLCLGLLINIVTHAILSAPLPFQQLAFDQPNRGVLYFPYVWLPAFIVPVVLFSHLVALRKLLTLKNENAGT